MRAREICRTAGLALLLLGSAWPTSAQATFPGQNGKIAFLGFTAAGGGVHVVEPDGTGQALVVSGGQDPAWSADGSRLAYFDYTRFPGALSVADSDGSGQSEVRVGSFSSQPFFSNEDRFREPAWSRDGGTIAYAEVDNACAPRVGCHDAPEGIRGINPDGTGDRALIRSPASDPAYSPDGTKIAWADHIVFGSGIHVSNPDGTGDTQLTAAEPVTGNGLAFDPSWSPDGTRIAFTSFVTANNAEIYVMDADGSNQTRLTSSEAPDDVDPVWSPDGTKIAWSRDSDLWVMNADGSGQTPLGGIRGVTPDWQPLVGPRRADHKNASHFCKAEREFLGAQEFGQKYGNHGGCVSRSR
jgi:TolB protein